VIDEIITDTFPKFITAFTDCAKKMDEACKLQIYAMKNFAIYDFNGGNFVIIGGTGIAG
jgi:hypothetical protein